MRKIIPFLILSCSLLFAKDLKIETSPAQKKSNPSVSEIIIRLKSMEGNLKKLNSRQIGDLDRLKESLAGKNEKAAREYIKYHADDFYYYEPAAQFVYKQFNANMSLFHRGARKKEVLGFLKTVYKWYRLDEEFSYDPEKDPKSIPMHLKTRFTKNISILNI
ncbi:hypothetical protein DQM68_08390 [Leptospira mayottensis]|uniref:Uncharacterized protein n=2 Tax=Leptospira mayottensis TaxID=1137606 RepID=A0AA87SV30_9LEPT|nr:hypothetical protein DQM68_08390 [Leptospira mayottensis]AXR64565.1 hypothetical protein DQM28_10350 [Leptospira mayottensis]AZQ02867.1 hypothetical protein LEP1GSC190_13300 [Leptospira mayottensis 200901116]EKR98589.1 hypothetical protein LEP1GSC125_1902 [Leptospira mayottensis 200901122]TGM95090.1 hypothetical protein EHR03_17260 [Leptospira mayottensis]